MMETQYITLNMVPSGVLPVLYCSQYDIGRPLGMVVYNGGEAVNLGDYTVTIEATRTDGAAITAAVTTDGNIGAFETTATMTNKADRYGAQLVLSAFGKRVASLPFVMCVVKAAMDENSESIEEDESLYQQYTETVEALIDEIKEYVKKKNIGILYPPLALTNAAPGICQAMYDADGHAVLIDMGGYSSYTTIKTALLSAGITVIDHVIISHWHADHNGANYDTGSYATAYDRWKSDFDMSNTVFWIPIMPSTYGTDEDQYLTQSFAGHTINRVTSNGVIFTWHEVTYSVYNASAADVAYYDEHSPNDYNAYSFITYAECGRTRICNTADINAVACQHAVDEGYALRSVLMTAPHHGTDNGNSGAFADTVRPQYVYVPNHNGSTINAYRDGFFKSVSEYADIFANTENYPNGISFGVNQHGLYVAGSPSVITPYGNDYIRTVYVDPSASITDKQDGTEDHPFAYIRRAISGAKGITKIVLLGNTAETLAITGANGSIIIEGNNHSCGAITTVNGAVVELSNLTFAAGYWNDSRIVAINCVTQQKITGTNSFIRLTDISTSENITLLEANGCVISVIGISTPNRTNANPLFKLNYSYASGSFSLGQLGGKPLIQCIHSYANFNRLVEAGVQLLNIWNAGSPPLILYDSTASKYARILSNGTLQYVQNETDALKCKQISVGLDTPVDVPANTTTQVLTNFDITAVETDVSQVYSFTFDWANGSSAVAVDRGVSSGKLLNLKVRSTAHITISGVRLTLWYK